MIGVQRHEDRAPELPQRLHQSVGDEGRLDHGHAAVEAHDPHVRDAGEALRDHAEPAAREGKGISAREHHLPDPRIRRDVGQGGVEFGVGQGPETVRSDHLPAEAEAAIDRADVQRLEQHAVRVAVDDPGHRRVGGVADRVRALLGLGDAFPGDGNELSADRVVRVIGVDQLGHVRA